MKNIIILLTLSICFLSCSDEKPSGNFLDGTVWVCSETGAVYDNDIIQYSYQETHTLTFAGNTFIIVTEGRYDRDNDGRYEDEDSQTKRGGYKFEYPQTKLIFEDGSEITVNITNNQLTTESDNAGKHYTYIPKNN